MSLSRSGVSSKQLSRLRGGVGFAKESMSVSARGLRRGAVAGWCKIDPQKASSREVGTGGFEAQMSQRCNRPWRVLARLIACALVAHAHPEDGAVPHADVEQGICLSKEKVSIAIGFTARMWCQLVFEARKTQVEVEVEVAVGVWLGIRASGSWSSRLANLAMC